MEAPTGLCTTLIILLTSVISYLGFRSRAVEERYIFDPERILAEKEYHRLLTSSFLHADWLHLGMNMLSLYWFGPALELFLGKAHFLLIYFGAVAGGGLLALYVHRHHEYRAYGASGGVCGIIFAYILLFPGAGILAFPLPFVIPGWLYAIGFLLASFYGLKTARGNIGHDAHLGGAIVGLLITAGLHPQTVRYNLRVFLIVLGASILLLIYLWLNPLFLPLSSFFGRRSLTKRRFSALPRHKQEAKQVDAILEKVRKGGMDTLTEEEKTTLQEVSAKYQRRAESKKPESGLAI